MKKTRHTEEQIVCLATSLPPFDRRPTVLGYQVSGLGANELHGSQPALPAPIAFSFRQIKSHSLKP